MFYGKMENSMRAIILSANDVIANVLYIEEDEDGVSPLGMGQIELPYDTKQRREKDPERRPIFVRGDTIDIEINIAKASIYQNAPVIDDLILILGEIDEDNAETYDKLEETNKKFDIEWALICQKERMI